MAKNRLTGSRNWVRSGFAVFWILLGCVSGVYLFSVLTGPTLGRQTVKSAPDGQTSPDQELAAIQENLQALSQQVAGLSDRLEDGETTSAPVPSEPPARAPEPPAAAAEPAQAEVTPEPAAEPAPPPPAAETPSDAQAAAPEPEAQPQPEPEPAEQAEAEAQEPAPEPTPPPKPSVPPSVVTSPLEEPPTPFAAASPEAPGDAADQAAPQESQTAAPAEPVASPGHDSAEDTDATAPPEPAATETAALDPIALPPAANDGSTRYGIEIGIVDNRDKLRPLWREFLTNHAALVAGLQPRRVLAPDKKWRLIAGPFGSAAEAEQACALFQKAARPCEATVYAGDVL
jgi:hypothetical protein